MLVFNGSIRQTETGSIVLTPFPGAIETKPGSATVPFFGIEPVILDAVTGKVNLIFLKFRINSSNASRNYMETMLRGPLLSRTLGHPLLVQSTKIITDISRLTWRWVFTQIFYLVHYWLTIYFLALSWFILYGRRSCPWWAWVYLDQRTCWRSVIIIIIIIIIGLIWLGCRCYQCIGTSSVYGWNRVGSDYA